MSKKKSSRKWSLTVTDKQADVLVKALELFSGLSMGQLDGLLKFKDFQKDVNRGALRSCLNLAKQLMFPELPDNAYHGVGTCGDEADIAWDIHQVLRHKISWTRYPKGGSTVNFHEPFPYGSEPLCDIKEKK